MKELKQTRGEGYKRGAKLYTYKGGRNAWGGNESAKQISAVININFSGTDCEKIVKHLD
jgi:hypothetical protein